MWCLSGFEWAGDTCMPRSLCCLVNETTVCITTSLSSWVSLWSIILCLVPLSLEFAVCKGCEWSKDWCFAKANWVLNLLAQKYDVPKLVLLALKELQCYLNTVHPIAKAPPTADDFWNLAEVAAHWERLNTGLLDTCIEVIAEPLSTKNYASCLNLMLVKRPSGRYVRLHMWACALT